MFPHGVSVFYDTTFLTCAELSWPEVYGNLLLWILHSHQTMISTLQFVIYMLAHNPEYQTMAFDEMKFTLGKVQTRIVISDAFFSSELMDHIFSVPVFFYV